jgi:acetyl esterase/lipase
MTALSIITSAQALSTNSLTFPLWPDGAPGALGKADKDIPTLTPYLAPANKTTRAAMVICPGGGYQHLAEHEGSVFAQWLNEQGISCFVLKYRLGPDYHNPSMLQDVSRALRTVRAKAAEWNVDPNRIGIMGSSAGGHLASTLLTHFDGGNTNSSDVIERQSSRPNLGILCYPVISMGQYTHRGSKNNLIGSNAPPELVAEFSNELRVSKDTPPCFLWHTYEDKTVAVENSLMFAEALRKAEVPFDLHIYQKGGHGQGLGIREYKPENLSKMLPWTADCIYWLKSQGFAN